MSASAMYYTYLHRRLDTNEVFYVGKGRHLRCNRRDGRSRHWSNIVSKAGFVAEILAHWDLECDAHTHEIFLIAMFRDLGAPLVNLTLGGEGCSGRITGPETRKKMSASLKISHNRECLRQKFRDLANEPLAYLERCATLADPIVRAKAKASLGISFKSPQIRARRSVIQKERMATATGFAQMQECRLASNKKLSRPVLCVETGVVFPSVTSAAKAMGTQHTCVSRVCSGQLKTAKSYSYRYADFTPSNIQK